MSTGRNGDGQHVDFSGFPAWLNELADEGPDPFPRIGREACMTASIIKAISLWQPWASLWLSPAKRHETRHWATRHRGKLLVHAAKMFCTDLEPTLREILEGEFGHSWATDLPRGALLGMIDLEECVPCEKIAIESTDRICGNFDNGRFGWRRGPTFLRFQHPVPYRGQQGLFDVPASAIEQAMYAVVKWETEA